MLSIDLSSIVRILFIVIVLCIDSFVISIAYGSNNIKIPFTKSIIISFIGSCFLGISLYMGNFISSVISVNTASKITFIILFGMGFIKLIESIFKYLINQIDKSNKKIDFKISNINFSLDINLQEQDQELRTNYILKSKEAILLGIALSIDSLALGLGISLIEINYFQIIITLFLISILLINLGCYIGRRISRNKEYEIGWLNGLVLMGMAVSKILKF